MTTKTRKEKIRLRRTKKQKNCLKIKTKTKAKQNPDGKEKNERCVKFGLFRSEGGEREIVGRRKSGYMRQSLVALVSF